MALNCRIFYFSFLFLLIGASESLDIKILIDERTQPSWKFTALRGFKMMQADEKTEVDLKATHHAVTITVKNGSLHINGTRYEGDTLILSSIKRHTFFNGNYYDGYFYIQKKGDGYCLINCLELEEYVFGVLKTESWPGWPLEMHKVMAIVCRTYALYQRGEAERKKLCYHLMNTNTHQTYSGAHITPILRQAVQETKGQFVSYKNKPILAMFDCCCGSVIPAHIQNGGAFALTPYLARSYVCNYCKSYPSIYAWRKEYRGSSMRHLLEEKYGKDQVGDVIDMKVTRKDKAGLVKEVLIKTSRRTLTLSGADMYKYIKGIKSFVFTITVKNPASKNRRYVVIEGKGFGHHSGLCQWGARQMIKEGRSYLSALAFYYPGTTVV